MLTPFKDYSTSTIAYQQSMKLNKLCIEGISSNERDRGTIGGAMHGDGGDQENRCGVAKYAL